MSYKKKTCYSIIMSVCLLSLVDDLLTFWAIPAKNFREMNPIFNWVLENFGPTTFIWLKMTMVTVPGIFMCLLASGARGREKILIDYGITTTLVLYLLLIAYWLYEIAVYGIDFG